MENPFVYRRAVVCGIADSLPAAALRLSEPNDPVDLQKARMQHQQYVDVLKVYSDNIILYNVTSPFCCLTTCFFFPKSLVEEVVELPADDRFPDCVFVEDPVVVCGDTALITIPGGDAFLCPFSFGSLPLSLPPPPLSPSIPPFFSLIQVMKIVWEKQKRWRKQ